MDHGLALAFALLGIAATPSVQAGFSTHEGDAAAQMRARDWNRSHALSVPSRGFPAGTPGEVLRPFSEVEKTGYVVIDSGDPFELPSLRAAIARNLPSDVTLVVTVPSISRIPALRAALGPDLGTRLKFLKVPAGGNSNWTRDSMPFPVFLKPRAGVVEPPQALAWALVDSIYPQDYEPDAALAAAFEAPLIRTETYFRGGNLLFDASLNCFAEKAREVAAMPDPETFYKTFFNCATVTVLEHRGGIGDIDERLKFLPDGRVLTDDASYAEILRARGYDVRMIPRAGGTYRTYLNTLYVNGTVFVPQMGTAADPDAMEAYRQLGLAPVGVLTPHLADFGHGNIHCLTMNYPEGTFVSSPRGDDFLEFSGASTLTH